MSKRKILLLAAAVCLIAILAVGGTLAYFTDSDEAKNVFTVGNIDIELTEPEWVEAQSVYPGQTLPKDPTVTNTGKNPCFVRLSVTGWDCLVKAGLSKTEIVYVTDGVEKALGDNWVLHTDGYYYYTKVLSVGAVTDALFDEIIIPADTTNGDGKTAMELDVCAYAVQAQGAKVDFADVEKMTVAEIADWFDTAFTNN